MVKSPEDCPLLGHEKFINKIEKREWRAGPFSVGDLIAVAGIIFMSGALWVQVAQDGKDIHEMRATDIALNQRMNAVELTSASNYVMRSEYREDTKEIKDALLRIEQKVDGKVDRANHAK